MQMKKTLLAVLAAAAIPALAMAQVLPESSGIPPTSNRPEVAKLPAETIPEVVIGGRTVDLWPYTGEDFSRTADPINLVFLGNADPRQIRAALLTADGHRPWLGTYAAYPPFNCTWADGAGYTQPAYAAGEWSVGAIQMECGNYQVLRTHLRLFRFKNFTLGAAHFEMMAPGTADHYTLAWDFAEQLVVKDLEKTGYATKVGVTDPINPTPFYETVFAPLYPYVPGWVKQTIGLTSMDKPNGDGRATVLEMTGTLPVTPSRTEARFIREYATPAPKPFCDSGGEYVYIKGPLEIAYTVVVDDQGEYRFEYEATGTLAVTPLVPPGPMSDATVKLRQHATLTDGIAWGEDVMRQEIHSAVEQALFWKLRAGNQERYEYDTDCGSPE